MPRYNKIHIDINTKANGTISYRPWASNGMSGDNVDVDNSTLVSAKNSYILVPKGKGRLSFDSKEEAISIITNLIKKRNENIEHTESQAIINTETETIDI